MGAEKIPPTQAEALARRIRDALGPFNDPNEPVQSLVEKLAERALSAAPPSESAPAQPATAVGEAVGWTWKDRHGRIHQRHRHPTPPALHTAPDAGEGEVVAWATFRNGRIEGMTRAQPEVQIADWHPLVRKSAYDAAVGVLREAREIVAAHASKYMRGPTLLARIDTLLTEASREG